MARGDSYSLDIYGERGLAGSGRNTIERASSQGPLPISREGELTGAPPWKADVRSGVVPPHACPTPGSGRSSA